MQGRVALVMVILAGCSAPEGSQQERFVPTQPVTGIIYDTVTGTAEGAWEAVQTPLKDLNLERQPIPEKLQKLASNPYVLPLPLLCDSLHREIAELDALLGPDVCTPENPTGTSRKGEYINRGTHLARDQAVNEVSSKINVIPFRGMVRYASGAEKHAKDVERAYEAGKLRRAFLKGLEASLGPNCVNQPVNRPLAAVAPSAVH